MGVSPSVQRAYSTLEIKSVDEDQRIIEGIATTPSTDRMDDIVDPKGANYTLPIPLLWQHNSREPVGQVLAATVTSSGIKIRAQFAKIDEPGKLKDRLDEAWQSVKAKLVRALSIGFDPIESLRIEGTFGFKYVKWDWLELSCVTIPANADATITAIKHYDELSLAATGTEGRPLVRRSSRPGASGFSRGTSPPPRSAMKKSISEQITDLEATRKDTVAKMTNLVTDKGAGDPGALDGTDAEQYDTYGAEVEEIDTRLKRLQTFERVQTAPSAQPVLSRGYSDSGRDQNRPHIEIKSNLPPGIEFARLMLCKMAAAMTRGDVSAMEVAKMRYPDNPRIQMTLKAAVAGGTTTDSTWAGPLIYADNLVGEFIDYLRPQTIVGKFGTGNIPSLRRVPFNVRMVGQTSGGSAGWVGQGIQKPVTKFDYSPTSLAWAKLAAIAVFSDELARFSSPSAEQLVRDGLTEAIRERLDIDFVDPGKAAVSNVSPASITNGATDAGNPAGTTAAHVRVDVADMMAPFIAASIVPDVWIMSATVAMNLSLMMNELGQPEFPGLSLTGGTFMGLPVIVSEYAKTTSSPTSHLMVLVKASEIFLSDDGGVTIDASREATIEMSSDPDNESGTNVNMFQTNQIALRAERFINWARRRSGAVVYRDGIAYAPSAS